MRKLFNALLLSAAATGIAALVLQQLDLDGEPSTAASGPSFPGDMPDDMPDEDVEKLLSELGSMLGGQF